MYFVLVALCRMYYSISYSILNTTFPIQYNSTEYLKWDPGTGQIYSRFCRKLQPWALNHDLTYLAHFELTPHGIEPRNPRTPIPYPLMPTDTCDTAQCPASISICIGL